MSVQWVKKIEEPIEPSPTLEIPELVWEFLYLRGFKTSDQVQSLLQSSLKELTPPFHINDMKFVVERLIQAFRQQQKILLYADFDLDGTSGLALLKKGLELCGFQHVDYYQPKRLSEGYGVHAAAIEKCVKERGIELFVTIDVGVTDLAAAEKALELGVDLIVTDHHQPKEELPKAYAIINPNLPSCDSNLGHLCGAGVAFYLLMALKNQMKSQGLLKQDFSLKELLDCFAIGTLTDMVPLVRENRSLVRHGLVELAQTKRPGLKALLKELGLWGKPLTGSDVAIRFAPKLNALSRMEMEILPIDIFLEEDERRAEKLVSQVMKYNQQRVQLQKSAEKEAFVQSFEDHDDFVWVYSPNFHQGVIGLVATKLAQAYGVPAFVGCVHEDGRITGSSRLPEMSEDSLLTALNQAQECLVKFGGHAPAAGFELLSENAEDFRQRLKDHYSQTSGHSESANPATQYYDLETPLSRLDNRVMNWLDQVGPFGTQFEFPVLRFNDLLVMNLRELKGGHIRLTVKEEGSEVVRETLWFSPNKNHPFFTDPFQTGLKVNLLAEPQWNHYQGRKSIQLLLKDIQVIK